MKNKIHTTEDIPEEFLSIAKELVQLKDLVILPGKELELAKYLYEANKEKRQLRIKLGIDPTSTDLHLGHTVCLRLLKIFQDLGHLPVLIIGGFTATVGDPSGRDETRPPLSYDQVEAHARTYLAQVSKILDLNKIEVVNNYDWLSKLTSTEVIKLAHLITVNRLIDKEAFGKRISENQPLYLHEVLYPLLVGYDSVVVKADIEIGGIDQTFNILFSRHVQKYYRQKEQLAIFLPLLIGLDGTKKMSKTFGNYIALTDTSCEVYGKTMSIPDELIIPYFKLVTSASFQQINKYKNELDAGNNPRDIKMILAKEIVTGMFNSDVALKEEENFVKQFRLNQVPDEIAEFVIGASVKITELMVVSKLASSKAEAKRLIEGGGVKLSTNKVKDPNLFITSKHKDSILQVGKRKFLKLV